MGDTLRLFGQTYYNAEGIGSDIMLPWWIALAAFIAGEVCGIWMSLFLRKERPKCKYIK